MEPQGIASEIHRFGPFEVDLTQRRLTSRGVPVRLQEQPFLALEMLLEHPGEIVTRDDLRQRLWPQGTHVDFEGSLNAVLKRLRSALNDDADRPRFIETIPKHGYRFIAPVARGAEAANAPLAVSSTSPVPAAALAVASPGAGVSPEAGASPGAAVAPIPAGRPVLRVAILICIGLVALGALVGLRSLGRVGSTANTAAAAMTPIPPRRSIAVLGFQNISGNQDDAWLSTALSQMLSTELAAGEKLRIVSGEEVANLRASSPWSQTDTLGQPTTSRIGTALNSDLLVLGSYAAVGQPGSRQLRLDARLQEAATGEILAEVAEVGSDQNPFPIVARVGGRMRGQLGVPPLTASDQPGILAALPSNGEAARLYAQGLMKLREFDAAGAKEFFQQTVAVDPDFPFGHSMLAQAWGQLGYDQKSREEARKALDLSAHLPRAEKMMVEGAYYESLGDPERASATYRALLTLFPDDLDVGLRLVTVLTRVGRYEEALETIKQLHRLPPPAGDDARLDILEAKEISAHSEPEAAIPLQRGKNKAAARGQKLIYASARLQECVSLQYSDHPADARPACQEAYDIFLAAGNRTSAAAALRNLADRTADEGRKDEALQLYDRAITMLRETGSRSVLAAVENNMALVLEAQGQLDRAESLFLDVKRNFEEVGDKLNVGTALDNIADLQVGRGDLAKAAETYQQVISMSVSPDGEGYTFYRLAIVHFFQGRLREAQGETERALKMFAARGADFRYATEAMIVLGDILMARGDLDGARRQYQESLATRIKLADPGLIAQSRASLAALAIEDGRPREAEADLRGVLPEFEKEKDVAGMSETNLDLTRALLMQGRIEEARKTILLARDLARAVPDPALTLPVATQDARVSFAMTGSGSARRGALDQLRSTITKARRQGYVGLECEARLALGELELQTDPRHGRSELEGLADETHARGLELISRKASLLLGPPAKANPEPDAPRIQ